jgi:hypothetical protein
MRYEDLKTKESKCEWEIYRRLFEASTPRGNFDALVEYAVVNDVRDEQGKISIPFMDYEIEQEKLDNIIEQVCKELKIRKFYRSIIKTRVYLGCSPRFTKISDDG